jgi:O-antigen/teichoic acid export membrane protein
MRASSLGSGALYGLAATALEKAVALGIALYLPRHLELPDYGRYAFVVAYLGFFQALPDGSVETALVARLAASDAARAGLAGRGAIVRLGCSLAGAALGLGVLAVAGGERGLLVPGAVWAVGLLATAASPYRVLLRADLRLRRYLALIAAQAAIALALLAVTLRAQGGLLPVLASVSVAALAALAIGRLLAGRVAWRLDLRLARGLLAGAWPLLGGWILLFGAQQILSLLLLRLHGPGAVGLLAGALKLVEAVGLLPQALMVSALPALAASGSRPAAVRAGRDVLRVLAILLAPVVSLYVAWPAEVLAVVLGPSFTVAAPLLRILGAAALLGASGTVCTNLLVAVGEQRALLRGATIGGLAMLGLGLTLVPAGGAIGVAVAIVGGLLAGQLVLAVLPSTRAAVRGALGGAAWPLALGAAAALVVRSLSPGPGVGMVLLGAGYLLALALAGTITRADLARWRR